MVATEKVECGDAVGDGILDRLDADHAAEEGGHVACAIGEAEVAIDALERDLGIGRLVWVFGAEVVIPEPDSHDENEEGDDGFRQVAPEDEAVGAEEAGWRVGMDVRILWIS